MCDHDTSREAETWLSRRQLVQAATATLLLPTGAHAADLVERDVGVPTPDGRADAFLVNPAGRRSPAVLIWPDILGLRPAMRSMARRLAAEGYAVLVVNPYYRQQVAPVVPAGASFRDPAIREKVLPMKQALTADTTRRDARALVAFLDADPAVDATRGMGAAGYCMGGPMVFWSAAELPERIHALASFHGGGLVTAEPDSPHLGVPKMKARALVAIAANDDEREPDSKTALRAAFDAAGLAAEIEVYEGTQHGWCPPDSAVHDPAQAERAWARLLALYAQGSPP